MKTLTFLLATLCLFAALGEAQFHDQGYLTCGYYNNNSTSYARGLWVINSSPQKAVSLFSHSLRNYHIYNAMMDADNRSIVFMGATTSSTIYAARNGIYRFNPATGVIQTLAAGEYNKTGAPHQWTYRALEMTQDGTYVFGMWGAYQTVPSTLNDYRLMTTNGFGSMTTLTFSRLATANISPHDAAIGRNIDSGRLLFQTRNTNASSLYNWYYGVLEIETNGSGKWATFSNGGGYYYPPNQKSTRGYGWYQNYGRLRQNFSNGALESVTGTTAEIHQLLPGQTPRTTLYLSGRPAGWNYRNLAPGCPDLQSAANPRWVVPAYWYKPTQGTSPWSNTPGVIGIDQQTYLATGHKCDPNNAGGVYYGATYNPYVFDLYRGRNIQTVKTGTKKWQLLFSCPSFPNKQYAAAISAKGIRPGIPLPDGRRIWLNFDGLVLLSIGGALSPYFNAGPLKLDKNGEAQGSMDLSSLPNTGGRPIHIAMVVIDVSAPSGIAFIPDTYVLRMP